MGLFWGSEDAAKVNRERERERLEETDPRHKPLNLMNVSSGEGYKASAEFSFMFRDMYQQVCEIHRSMEHLSEENRILRTRVELLEKQAHSEEQQNRRAI